MAFNLSGLLGGIGNGVQSANQGMNNYFSGQGGPAGYDPQDVASARNQSLAQMAALFLAGSQPMSGAQRAQYIAQVPMVGDDYRKSLRGMRDDRREEGAYQQMQAFGQKLTSDPASLGLNADQATLLQSLDPQSAYKVYADERAAQVFAQPSKISGTFVDPQTGAVMAYGAGGVMGALAPGYGGSVADPSYGGADVAPEAAGMDMPQAAPPAMSYPRSGVVGPLGQKLDEKLAEGEIKRRDGVKSNVSGAIGFLQKVQTANEALGTMTNNEFGPLEGGEGFIPSIIRYGVPQRFAGADTGKQDRFAGTMANLELDVAKMKLKGDGPITEGERGIAKATLGGLAVRDKATQQQILMDTSREALGILERGLRDGIITEQELLTEGIDINALRAAQQQPAQNGAAPAGSGNLVPNQNGEFDWNPN